MTNSPLEQAHLAAGARMTTFAGWRLPVSFDSALAEHAAVRSDAGMFDVSHMTVTDITGPEARDCVRFLLCSDAGRLEVGRGRYSCLLGEDAGIIDDLIVYRLADHEDEPAYRLVTNGATRDTVRRWLAAMGARFTALVEPRDELAMVAVQGPAAAARATPVLEEVAAAEGHTIAALPRFAALDAPGAFVARTGYTGEDGFEICIHRDGAERLWTALRSAGVVPCGLAARDTLRLEAALPLYGADMDGTTRPDEVGLAGVVDADDPERDFVGRAALAAAPPATRCRAGIALEARGVPRAGCDVSVAGGIRGTVTSGSFSPTLERGIALVRMDAPAASLPAVPAPAAVTIRGRQIDASLVKLPFVRGSDPVPVAPGER